MPIPESSVLPAVHHNPSNTPIHTVPSDALLGTQSALHIAHKGAIYTLRATSKGGLILTK
jgi:hemin uptake protein HemP